MNAKHTPTPWTLSDKRPCEIYGHEDGDRVMLVEAFSGSIDPKEAKANVAFIVRAVNAHDELLATLEAYTNSEYAKSRLDGTLLSANYAQAMTALAKAEEE